MYKILLILSFTLFLFINSVPKVSAQMMGYGWNNRSISCNQPDSYYENIGDKYITSMMGEEQDKLIDERMGEDLSKAMHIRMGKAASGCFNGGYYGMMGGLGFGSGYYLNWTVISIIQILAIVALVFLIIFLWKKISQEKRRK